MAGAAWLSLGSALQASARKIFVFLSVVLMAVASNYIARILDRHHWVAWIGFLIIVYVAGDMIWDGTHEVVAATGTR